MMKTRSCGRGWMQRTGHGATPTTATTHIAVLEALNGKPVNWMVGDRRYRE
jgi:hypothetical protein